ncbi:MAG: ferritin family protein [Deltaproteobacteria bacterium]|nr:ferritin family protein [Deltaproteobacteria bacterium]
MDSYHEEVLKGLRTAMEAEMTGHAFYKNAADSTADPKGKETFLRLAQEEMGHFKYLKTQYKSILEKGGYDFTQHPTDEAHKHASGPIFSADFKKRLKESHFEISVLSIGMKLELDAIAFYRSCAEKAREEKAKELYLQLAEWEQGHYDAFARELDNLKEEYWRVNNFVPM